MALVRKKRRELVWGTATGLLAILLVALLARTSAFVAVDSTLEARLLGAQQRAYPADVVLVEVDDRSFTELEYPFPRRLYAKLIDALTAAGVKAIGVDAVFTPTAVDGPGGSAAFARALENSGHTVLAVACAGTEARPRDALAQTLSGSTVALGPTGALECPSAIAPFPPLAGASLLGHVQLARAHSDANRGLFAFVDVGQQRIPALALQLYLAGEGLDRAALTQKDDGVGIGRLFVPTTDAGEVLVSPRRQSSLRRFSFADLLHAIGSSEPARLPEALAQQLRGRYVVIGGTAIQINDTGHDVTGELIPLVLMHASLLSDLIEDHFVSTAPAWLQLAVVLGFGLLATALALNTRPILAVLSIGIVVFGIVGGTLLVLRHGVLLAPLAPICAAVLAFVAALTSRMIVREKERGILRSAFGSYVDSDHLERILEAPDRYLSLGGARKEVTVLFSDIQGYTGLSNALPPEEVISLLREYLGAMTHRVRERGGRVDKIMGDGIMAVFGDPMPNARHAITAVEVALDMQRTMSALRERWVREGKAPVGIRIGIATGEVFVGNVGSPGAKMEYTALGATVNLASRLEGRAPVNGVLVSSETAQALGDAFELEAVHGLTLKGFSDRYDAYLIRGVRLGGTRAAGG